jgi:inositol oxygenase
MSAMDIKIDDWDKDVRARYDPQRRKDEFRNYGEAVPSAVRELYRLNHANQSYAVVDLKRQQWLPLNHTRCGIWEMMEQLSALTDESDPDTDLNQIEHCLQTAEAIRASGRPDWLIVTGLIHDLGKVLWMWGEPQWAVVGDTFPLGCAFSDKIVFHELFAENPDSQVSQYQSRCGIYESHCGLDKVYMSWGHDEYLYYVTRDYLPVEAQYIIRYHSFYSAHREGAYTHLMNARDLDMFHWVRLFNPFDLYSKSDRRPDTDRLKPYYKQLVEKFFPNTIRW